MDVTLGFSPCPNDTYMFAALVNQWIDTKGLQFHIHMEDVEQLNEWAGLGHLDVTKMSFHRAMSLEDTYQLLSSGSALGIGCGPILISSKPRSRQEILEGPIALPGHWTTAHLLFNLFYPGCQLKEFHLFSDIERLVAEDKVVAGVIIHENRFTYEAKGLQKITDLGEAWENETLSPIPLGGIFAHRRFSDDHMHRIESLIRESIQYARDHPKKVMEYVRLYSQEMNEEVMKSHIELYVNDFSLDLCAEVRQEVALLKKKMR